MNFFQQLKYNSSSLLTQNSIKKQIVPILSTVIEDLKTVKLIKEQNKFPEVAARIMRIDRALESIEQSFSSSENKEQAEKVMQVYNQLRFGLKLVALKNGKAEEYDYYIDYITNIKQMTENVLENLDSYQQQSVPSAELTEQQPVTVKESSSSSEDESAETKNFFNIKGHLEVNT